MQAILYCVNPLGWLTCKALHRVWPGCRVSRLAGLRRAEVPSPPLPADDWVRVRTLLGGICGSDTALLAQAQPPDSLLQAFSSFPILLGHENVAVVEEVGPAADAGWLGRRVCVEPTLSCEPRGIEPPCGRCRDGQYGACERFGADGLGRSRLPPGTSIGYNAATGGSLGEQFVAHVGRLVPVPDALSDEQAVLTDPLACSVHAVLRADLSAARRVLVYGAGMLGLGVAAALRAVGYDGAIDALGRHEYLRPLVEARGATYLALPRGRAARHEAVARRTGATVHRARFGNRTLAGGYDVTFDCVGSQQALSECLRWTRSRGQVVLVGTGHGRGVDMTPIWFTELTVRGAYGRSVETVAGRRIETYALTHEWMTTGRLPTEGLLTHTFRPAEYKRAFAVTLAKARHEAVKVAIDWRT